MSSSPPPSSRLRFKPIIKLVCLFLLGVLLGGCGGYLYFFQYSRTWRGSQHRLGQQEFIDPLIDCEITNREVPEFHPLQATFQKIVDAHIGNKSADQISIYFRALNSGRWVGINEDQKFTAASLMKLPYMMTYDKLFETDPSILSKSITFNTDQDYDKPQNIKPAESLIPGQAYSVEELLRRMIVYSGNNAMMALVEHLDKKLVDQLFQDLGITEVTNDKQETLLSPKDYSVFFRALYNASYLNQEQSDKALKLLSTVEYHDGLVAGVPDKTVIAHKFGERTYNNNIGETESAELHDCGIIYHPFRPYFLCVMTSGHDQSKLSPIIQELSKVSYDFVTGLGPLKK